jgi:hypothetical protein
MPRPRKDYRIALRRDGTLTNERGHPLDLPRAWTGSSLAPKPRYRRRVNGEAIR